MNPQPETVALAGYAMILVFSPLISAMLVFVPVPHGGSKWLVRSFALVLMALWLPLAISAPQVIAQLS